MTNTQKRLGKAIIFLFIVMGLGMVLQPAKAQELSFMPDVFYVSLDLPKPDLWSWKDAPAYKNERLAAYQNMLIQRGITGTDNLKLLTAQIIQENGSLSENVHGDHGCSVGILQYNACVHARVSAIRFLELHPEWKSWEYQLERMADMVEDRMEKYDGDIRLVVIHHNCPACAARGVDSKAGYYRSVKSRTSLLQAL